MSHLLFNALSVYFVVAFGFLSDSFNRTVLQAFIYLLPLTLLLIFKQELWAMGLVGVPLACMAVASSNIYAHREMNDHSWAKRDFRGYNAVLIIVAGCFIALNIGVFFSSSHVSAPTPLSVKEYFALPIAIVISIYAVYLSAHRLITYLIVPMLPYKTEVHQGSLRNFFKLVVSRGRGGPEIHYCIAFDSDSSYWQLRGSHFKQHVIKQGSRYEYTVCTGFLGNKFIKGTPRIITSISTMEQQANRSTYYPRKQYIVLKWGATLFGGLMIIVVAFVYLLVLILQLNQMPEVVIFPILQIVLTAMLFQFGVFLSVMGFIKIIKTAKYTHSPIPYIGRGAFSKLIQKDLQNSHNN